MSHIVQPFWQSPLGPVTGIENSYYNSPKRNSHISTMHLVIVLWHQQHLVRLIVMMMMMIIHQVKILLQVLPQYLQQPHLHLVLQPFVVSRNQYIQTLLHPLNLHQCQDTVVPHYQEVQMLTWSWIVERDWLHMMIWSLFPLANQSTSTSSHSLLYSLQGRTLLLR